MLSAAYSVCDGVPCGLAGRSIVLAAERSSPPVVSATRSAIRKARRRLRPMLVGLAAVASAAAMVLLGASGGYPVERPHLLSGSAWLASGQGGQGPPPGGTPPGGAAQGAAGPGGGRSGAGQGAAAAPLRDR